MLTYDLSKRKNRSLYEYLYICIRNDIKSGRIKAKEKLPSKRTLAANLHISIITVQNAYDQLVLEGYIYGIEKKGYYACEIVNENVAPFEKEYSAGHTDITLQTSSSNENYTDFSEGATESSLFPFSVWAGITRRYLSSEQESFMKKTDNKGLARLRCAVSQYLRENRGFETNPDNIIIGAGTEYLYGLIAGLLGRNKMIATEDPGHTKVHRIYENNGIRLIYVPIDDKGIIAERIDGANISAVHISPSHQFPTGIVMPAERRHAIIAGARQHDFYVIEDDYDSEFRFVGKPLPTMAELDRDRVIYLNTFSRTISPSVRIAYMILPDRLMEEYNKKLEYYSTTVCAMEQYTLAEFITGGYYERYIGRMRNYYKKYRTEIFEALDGIRFEHRIEIEKNDAGLHFIIYIPEVTDDKYFAKLLLDKGIKIKSVSQYCFRPEKRYQHRFIVNYSGLAQDKLILGLKIMDKYVGSVIE